MDIRSNTIAYSIRMAKLKHIEENNLERELKEVESKLAQDPNDDP